MLACGIEAFDREADRILVVPIVEELSTTDVVRITIAALGLAFARRLSRTDEMPRIALRPFGAEAEFEVPVCVDLKIRGVERAEGRAEAGLEF